jgi:hypothetical protein
MVEILLIIMSTYVYMTNVWVYFLSSITPPPKNRDLQTLHVPRHPAASAFAQHTAVDGIRLIQPGQIEAMMDTCSRWEKFTTKTKI